MNDQAPDFLSWTDGNAVRLLQNGADFFPALCAAIDAAQRSVHLETYIFAFDPAGDRVLDRLVAAARRGVHVCVVLDGFGSHAVIDRVRGRLAAVDAQCLVFRPEPRFLGKLVPARSRLRRLHRKTAVIDAAVAFVGGINIEDDYDEDSTTPRFDFAVQIRGPLVADVMYAQDLLHVRLNWVRLRASLPRPQAWHRMRQIMPLLKPRRTLVAEAVDTDLTLPSQYDRVRAALVLRDNVRYRQVFERAYLCCIRSARHEILIANAYFFPGMDFRKALLDAAARGVRVRILLQGKSDHRILYYATRALYDTFIAGGIEIYEYRIGYLHAKAAVMDGIATVGSSNLDPFSLLLAREANVVVDHAAFGADLKARIEHGIARGGTLIEQQDLRRRGWLRRGVETLSFFLLRLGVALTGKADSF